jgi:HSP20 family molecular chaperone IbpA
MNELTKQDAPETTTVSQQQPNGTSSQDRYVTPRSSVFDTADAVVVELEMPGVGRDNIDITVDKDELTVTGHRTRSADEGYELVHQERLLLSYRRSFVLSERIDTGNIAASYDNGVLRLSLPKSAEAKPRKISID